MANNRYNEQAYTLDYFSQYDSSISNGEARIPICFCIDTSTSMTCLTNKPSDYEFTGVTVREDGNSVDRVRMKPGKIPHTRIDEVQRVLAEMISRMKSEKRICNAAVICIVTFDLYADCIVEFSDLNRISYQTIRNIQAGEDYTNASKGIDMALGRLDQFRNMHSRAGNESYKPVLIFMSDGNVSNDSRAAQAKDTVRERAENGTLNVIPIGIGNQFDSRWMRQLSSDSRVYRMDHEEDFDKVFQIITRRIERTLSVISVDEEICESVADTYELPEDCEHSTAYGSSNTIDDLSDFMNWCQDV